MNLQSRYYTSEHKKWVVEYYQTNKSSTSLEQIQMNLTLKGEEQLCSDGFMNMMEQLNH